MVGVDVGVGHRAGVLHTGDGADYSPGGRLRKYKYGIQMSLATNNNSSCLDLKPGSSAPNSSFPPHHFHYGLLSKGTTFENKANILYQEGTQGIWVKVPGHWWKEDWDVWKSELGKSRVWSCHCQFQAEWAQPP